MMRAWRVVVLAVLMSWIGSYDSASLGIPLTKCCPGDDEFYVLGFDTCKVGEGVDDEDVTMHWPPPVHSIVNGKEMAVHRNDFNLTYGLATCPDGYISQAWTDFRLYDDGMVLLVQHGRYQPGNFCIGQINTLNPEDNGFVVRHCVEDPCRGGHCIRKCCPEGMDINDDTRSCQKTSFPFDYQLQDENGNAVNKPDSPLIIQYGVAPNCKHGILPHSPETNPDEIFYILPNGTVLFPKENPNNTEEKSMFIESEYCIDNLSTENGSEIFMLTCFPPDEKAHWTLNVYPYFLFAASIFLIATFVVYALLPEIRNIHGISIMCHVASMAVMFIGLGIIQIDQHLPHGICIGLAVVVHYFFLTTFTWLNVMSFDIWWTFSDLRPLSRHGRRHTGRRIIFYSFYAWTVPLLFVLTGLILNSVDVSENIIIPGFGLMTCWFHSRDAVLMYLNGPMAVLLISNLIFFLLTVIRLYQASVENVMANNHKSKQKLRVIFSLFFLMGLSWILEFISYVVESDNAHWFVSDILNILTGVFIFVLFVCKPNVWKLLKFKFPCLEALDPYCPSCMKAVGGRGKGTSHFNTRHETSSISIKTQTIAHQHEDVHRMVSDTPSI